MDVKGVCVSVLKRIWTPPVNPQRQLKSRASWRRRRCTLERDPVFMVMAGDRRRLGRRLHYCVKWPSYNSSYETSKEGAI